jgi:phage terminase large subunit
LIPQGYKLIDTGYRPRPLQADLHKKVKRFNVIVCHRRFGKTVWALNHIIDRALKNPLNHPQYAYLAPQYAQAKRVVWGYLKRYTENIPGVIVNEAELRIDIPRPGKNDFARIMLLGAENPDSLKGIYLDGAILDEYAQMNPSTWSESIRPTLSDRKGWAIFLGTPKGQNAFYDLFEHAKKEENTEWSAAIYKSSETGIIDGEELESLRKSMSEEEFEQEYECSFAAGAQGSYYAKIIAKLEQQNRIRDVSYDPAAPVDTYWDLGIGDSMVVWFIQQVFNNFHVIDYEEHSGLGIPEMAAILKKKDYSYGVHMLPHDAAARELGTGKARIETFRLHGIRGKIVPKSTVDDGIQQCRLVLPRCYFDRVKTERGLKALRNYQREWDPKLLIFKSNPKHDWASHGADGFRTFAMGVRDTSKRENRTEMTAVTEYSVFS